MRRPDLLLAAAAALVLSGCAFDDTSAGASFPDMGVPNSDLGAQFDAGGCNPNIMVSSSPAPSSPNAPLYPPVVLTASVRANPGIGAPHWTLSVSGGALINLDSFVSTQSNLIVTYPANLPGDYVFYVDFNGACPGMSNPFHLSAPDAVPITYRLRVTPPESLGVPQQDDTVTVSDGLDATKDLFLQAGSLLSGTLAGPSGGVAGEVRLLAVGGGPDAVATTSSGAFFLRLDGRAQYRPLLLPASAALAPRLFDLPVSGADLTTLAGSGLTVDAGESVAGVVSDPLGAAIAGARVVWRNGLLPSSLGQSAADGSYTLRARAGSGTLSVGAGSWPELAVPGVTVVAGVTTTLDVQYLIAAAPVTAQVIGSSGQAVAGARVTIRSPLLDGAARLTADGVAATVGGRVNTILTSGAGGRLPALALPALPGGAQYDLIVEPPAGSSDGLTALSLPGGGPWMIALAKRIALAGTLKGPSGAPVAGAQVTAFETAGLGAAPTAVSGADGSYHIDGVDPGAPVRLVVEPLGGGVGGAQLSLPAGTTSAAVSLPRGVRVSGSVHNGNVAAGGVVIEALCGGCGSPAPIASAITGSDGRYNLYLPDPVSVLVDAGTD